MLKSLTLHRFRHVEPGTVLRFTEGFNVLLGRNGTGKTTLLDLISMVLRSDFSALKEEEFDIEYEFGSERSSALVRFENALTPPRSPRPRHAREISKTPRTVPRVSAMMTRHLSGETLRVEIEGAAHRWRVGDDEWCQGEPVDVFAASLLPSLAAEPLGVVADLEAWVYVEGFTQDGDWGFRFDESLGVFNCMTEAENGREAPLGRVPAISLQAQFASMDDGSLPTAQRHVFVPWAYEPVQPRPGQSSTAVELPQESALKRFPVLAGVSEMSLSLAVEGSREEADGVWWRLGRAEFLFTDPGGMVFNQTRLSYGQKRLLAFLYYLDANPTYVVADELVNGMHHDWIRACLDEIGDRQSFLTSQNPLLLDYLPLESVEQVERTFIQCRREVVDDKVTLHWSNLTRSDAEELFADYKVGIQPLGEILRARGLW